MSCAPTPLTLSLSPLCGARGGIVFEKSYSLAPRSGDRVRVRGAASTSPAMVNVKRERESMNPRTPRQTWMRAVAVVLSALTLTFAATACRNTEAEGKDKEKPAVGAAGQAPAAVEVGRENLITVKREQISTGPLISGTLTAQREATVRAEVGGSVLEVNTEEGKSVRQGQVLARIEDQTQRDAFASAQSAVTSAQNSLNVATREQTRTENLVKAGALPDRDLETAQNQVKMAQAQLAQAQSQQATARKALDNASIKAPMTGVVSKRTVNSGDVVTTGGELLRIIDPSSMKLQASVPSEALADIKIGLAVQFQVRGYDQTFEGHIERISPTADPVTRQVSIFVTISNKSGRLVAGLFAEGRVTRASRVGLVVPTNAVNLNSPKEPWVLRVKDGKADKVNVTLGLRDDQTERVEIQAAQGQGGSLNEGDLLLVGAAQGMTPGTPVHIKDAQAPAQTQAQTPAQPRGQEN
jgi:membrane fusion protein, multidrug efflux system